MEREIDLAPRHLVDWLRAELARGGSRRFDVRATREFLAEDGPVLADGLDPEDEVGVATTVGTLEVAPTNGRGHWVLRLRVEDAIGSHLPDDGSVPDGPEEIGLDEFAACFLATDDTDASVTLETGAPADGHGFDRVLAGILADRHGRASRGSR
jgi:hypothetical protein